LRQKLFKNKVELKNDIKEQKELREKLKEIPIRRFPEVPRFPFPQTKVEGIERTQE